MITCLECGRGFKSLSGHVYRAHGITLREYRQAHSLALTNPLVDSDTRGKLSRAGKRRFADDPRVRQALSGEGAKRGRQVAASALRKGRSLETCQQISERRQRESDALFQSKLAAKGFKTLGEAATWAQSRGMTWNQMCQHLGVSFTATKHRAAREGVEVWRTIPKKTAMMLAQARDHVAAGGTLAKVEPNLSKWLAGRRWWSSRHGDGPIEGQLDQIDKAWR